MDDLFDLRNRPWISVERTDGSIAECSTRELFREAHKLRAIIDPSPLVVTAVTRHLLAILHRSYEGPRTHAQWIELLRAGSFDAQRIDHYLDSERVRDRMCLFHPETPFAQTPGLQKEFPDFVTPIDELEVVRARWGGGRALFQHRPETPVPSFSFARAARALLAYQAFATGGLIKKPREPVSATAAPLVRSAVVFLRGATLFETLVSNTLRYDPETQLPIPSTEQDACSWEQPPPPTQLRQEKEPLRARFGYLDMLTWLSRRVELLPKDGVVHGYINAVGKGINDELLDPMVTYRFDEERGRVPIGINPDRAFWRDAHALFEASREIEADFVRPLCFQQIREAFRKKDLPLERSFTIEISGMAAEKSRVDAVRSEHLHVHAKLLAESDTREQIETVTHFAETCAHALNDALRSFAYRALGPGQREPDGKDVTNLVNSTGAVPALWSALGVEFERFLDALATNPNTAINTFEERALQLAREEFFRGIHGLDATSAGLKARSFGESKLNTSLPKRTPTASQAPA